MGRYKTPWIAAILNLVIPGAGYIYVGNRLRFGVLLVAASLIVLFAPANEEAAESAETTLEAMLQDPAFISMLVAALLVAAAFAYDGWRDAKAYNLSNNQTDETSNKEE
ncbi:MAG: hypothetical protein WD061_02060 [Candidatus Saccharimonadales bacterium]